MHTTMADFTEAMRFARSLGDDWLTARELADLIAAQRNRPIALVPTDLTGTGITGTVLDGGERDIIVYATGLPPFFTEHVIFHELSHLLRGHLAPHPGVAEDPVPLHIDPAHEQEAELLATALAELRRERGRERNRGRSGRVDDGGLVATLAPHLLSQ